MGDSQYIVLSIFGRKGKVFFKVKRLAPLEKLFTMYEKHAELEGSGVEYYCRGRKLSPNGAPSQVNLQDKDMIFEYHPPSPTAYTPNHENHSDIAFEIDDKLFRLHKYPLLKTGSPFLEEFIEMDDGTPIPLPIPGGAAVFTLVAKFCYRDEENVAHMLTPFNVVAARLAASFLQMDGFMDFIDAYLDKVIFEDSYVTSLVLCAASKHSSSMAPENALVQRALAALAQTLNWREVRDEHPVLSLPPPVFAALVAAVARLHRVPTTRDLSADTYSYGEEEEPLWQGVRLLVDDATPAGAEIVRLTKEVLQVVEYGWKCLQTAKGQDSKAAKGPPQVEDEGVVMMQPLVPPASGTPPPATTNAASHIHGVCIQFIVKALATMKALASSNLATDSSNGYFDEHDEYATGIAGLWPRSDTKKTKAAMTEHASAFIAIAAWVNLQLLHPGLVIQLAESVWQQTSAATLMPLFTEAAQKKEEKAYVHPLERGMDASQPALPQGPVFYVSMKTPMAGHMFLPAFGIGAAAEPDSVVVTATPTVSQSQGAEAATPEKDEKRARRAGLLAAAAQARLGGAASSNAAHTHEEEQKAQGGAGGDTADYDSCIAHAARVLFALCAASLKSQNDHTLVQVFQESRQPFSTEPQPGDGTRIGRLPAILLKELLAHAGFSACFRRELLLCYLADVLDYVCLSSALIGKEGHEERKANDIWEAPSAFKAQEAFRRSWKHQQAAAPPCDTVLLLCNAALPLCEGQTPSHSQYDKGGLWPWLRGGEEDSDAVLGEGNDEEDDAEDAEGHVLSAAEFDKDYDASMRQENRDDRHPHVVHGVECNHPAAPLRLVDVAAAAASPSAMHGFLAAVFDHYHDAEGPANLTERLEELGLMRVSLLPSCVLESLRMFNASSGFPRLMCKSLREMRLLALKRDSELRKQICTSLHVPIHARIRVRRSSGKYEEGVIAAYSAQKGLHCVRYAMDARWYRLSEVDYEVVDEEDIVGDKLYM